MNHIARTSDQEGADPLETVATPKRNEKNDLVEFGFPEIPGYRFVSLLGRGGMGEVYLAEDLALRRQVAIKVMVTAIQSSAQALERFQSESRAVASVTHSGICQIFKAGEVNRIPYLVMEYIKGQTLSQVIRNHPPSPRGAAQKVQAIAETIHACHQAGILHRDLKPANVMQTESESIKVMDFGLAKRLGETDASSTRTGEILGTPCYMAPEQASGVAKGLGPECDVYGIGAILYEMLVGRPPHYGSDAMQTILQVRTADPIAPRTLQSRIPRDLETICLKCLEKEPSRRYSSAEALAQDLDRFLAGWTIQARPATIFEKGHKWSRRNPAKVAAIAMGLLTLLGAILGVTFHVNRLQRELNRSSRLFSQSQDWGSWLVNEHIPDVAKLRGDSTIQSTLVNKTLDHLRQLEVDISADRQLADYIAQAYEHIADVESDPAFATPLHLEQALKGYEHAVSLYTMNKDQPQESTQFATALMLIKASRVQTLLDRYEGAKVSIDKAIGLLTELIALGNRNDNRTANLDWRVALIDARAERTRQFAPSVSPQRTFDAFQQLESEFQSMDQIRLASNHLEVKAALAVAFGDWLESQSDFGSVLDPSNEKAIDLFQDAVDLLTPVAQQDQRLRWTLVTATTKLGDSLMKAKRYPEAANVLREGVDLQKGLVRDFPESDRSRIVLLSLLDRQFQVAQAQEIKIEELEAAESYQLQAEALYALDPSRYGREMRRAYTLSSNAYSDNERDEQATEFIAKATEQGRKVVLESSEPSDRRILAGLLKKQAQLRMDHVNKRSTVTERFTALQSSLALLEESIAIYDQLEESLATEQGSPYWLTIEFKHRLENDLDNAKRRNQETRHTESSIR